MSKVTRYSLSVEESEDRYGGEWVRYDEYKDEVNELQDQLNEALAKIQDLEDYIAGLTDG